MSEVFNSSQKYINRELSWLAFNLRVLEEAENKRHPLLERVRFLSISGSNLDEFYMVRVAGLKGQVEANVIKHSADGLTPSQQLVAIKHKAHDLLKAQNECWKSLKRELRKNKISVLDNKELKADDYAWLETHFMQQIFPILTPLAIDPAHPFPFMPTKGVAIALKLWENGQQDHEPLYAMVPLPLQLNRFIALDGEHTRFVALESVVMMHLDRLFPHYVLEKSGIFRIIRDSEMELDEDAEDLVSSFENALKKRKRGQVIRVGFTKDTPAELQDLIVEQLPASKDDVFYTDEIAAITDVKDVIVKDRPDLLFPPFTARFPERLREFGNDCFAAINHKDFLVHHPYESFDVVVQFVRQAASDPDVVSIKQTLYRTSDDSPIISALIEAAEAGKSVTAVVELKARFDEEANLKWARRLQLAGAQVVFGFTEMKIHAKVSIVVKREDNALRTYAHFGTGNYHPVTAKVYTDLSYFTCDPVLIADAAKIFNYMTGYARPEKMEKLRFAPITLRKTILDHLKEEIQFAREGKPAAVWAKMNSLVDEVIIDALYEASQAGVQIDLIIRGMCSLRPNVPGLSDNIRVRSIVGRFLEHSRIACFGNGSPMPSPNAKVYISSADWMRRNTVGRIETLVPIENETVHQQILDQIMVANLLDKQHSWTLNSDGSYTRVASKTGDFNNHHYFMKNPSLSGRGSAIIKKAVPSLIKARNRKSASQRSKS